MKCLKIVSGGQTGIDRAALDAAIAWKLPTGGWCPAGRKAEDGPIPSLYSLRETPTARYLERTQRNVRDSDGTLILGCTAVSPGTEATLHATHTLCRPVMVVAVDALERVDEVARWAQENQIKVLNVAGPRESELPGAYQTCRVFMDKLFICLMR